jgi:hypothetical protein
MYTRRNRTREAMMEYIHSAGKNASTLGLSKAVTAYWHQFGRLDLRVKSLQSAPLLNGSTVVDISGGISGRESTKMVMNGRMWLGIVMRSSCHTWCSSSPTSSS